MSTITKAIAAVEFQANSRQANAALDSIRSSAQDCRNEVERLQAELDKGIKMTVVDGQSVEIEKRIKQLNNMAKTYDQAAQSLVKGVKAFDELWKNAKLGTIETMTAAQIKAGMNGSKRVQDNLRLTDPEFQQKSDALQSMNDQAQKVLDRMKLHTDDVIRQLDRGEQVARDVLEREQKGLEAMLDQLKHGSEEWQTYYNQLVQIKQGVEALTITEKQLRGEIVTREDAMRVANQQDKEATQQAIDDANERIKKSQEVIDQQREEIKGHQETVDAAQSALLSVREEKAERQRALATAKRETEENNRLAKEKAQRMKTLHDEAVKNTKTEKDAYDTLDGEVKTLTTDVEKLEKELGQVNQEPVKPKVDTSEIDALNEKLRLAEELLQQKTTAANTAFNNYVSAQGPTPIDNVAFRDNFEKMYGLAGYMDMSHWDAKRNLRFPFDMRLSQVEDAAAGEGDWEVNKEQAQKILDDYNWFVEKIDKVAEAIAAQYKKLSQASSEGVDPEQLKTVAANIKRLEDLRAQFLKASEDMAMDGISRPQEMFGDVDKTIDNVGRNVDRAIKKAIDERYEFHKKKHAVEIQEAKEASELADKEKEAAQIAVDGIKAEIEAKKQNVGATKSETEAIKDKEAETQKLIQLQKELDEAMAKAGYNGKDAESIDLQASLNRSARVGLNNVQLTSRTWKNRFDDNASFEDWVKGYVGAEESDKFWVATAKDKIKNTMSSFLGGDKSLEDLKKFKEEWDKVAQGFLSEPKTSKGYYMEAINYIDNLIDKTVQLKEVEEKRAAVRNQKAVVDGMNQETQATEKQAEANHQAALSDEERAQKSEELARKKGELATKEGERAQQAEKVKQAETDEATAAQNAKDAQNEKNQVLQQSKQRVGEMEGAVEGLNKQEEKYLGTIMQENTAIANSEAEIDKQKAAQLKAQQEIDLAQKGSIEKKEEAIRVLEKLNREINDPGNADWQKNEQVIGQLKQQIEDLKQQSMELQGTWMSVADAMKYASSVGSDGFVTTDQQTKLATDALTRHREELIKTIQQKEADSQATATERAELEQLDQALTKIKTGFASADEVMTRWAEHMNAGKTASESMAQTLDEKLAGATSSFDKEIEDAIKDIADYDEELKNAEQDLENTEKELAELEKKHANSSWLRKKTSAYRREAWRIDNLRDAIDGREVKMDDGTSFNDGKKAWIQDLKGWKANAQERLDHWKKQKAEALGLNEAEEQVAQTEEKLQQTRRLTNEQMQQGIKLLEEEYAKTDHTTEEGIKKRQQLREAIDQMNQELKESTGEWMSVADAMKLAGQAEKNTFLDNDGTGFTASAQDIQKATQALERQRDALLQTIKAKRDNKNLTKEEKAALDQEEAELQDLTNKLKALKFEQDNFNMSQAKMQELMRTPTNAVSLDELRAAIKRADGELKRMEGSLGQNNAQYKAFAEQVRNAKNQLKEMEGQAKASATAWEKAWSRLKTYVVMYMGFNAAWNKMTSMADDVMELSDKMGEVRKTTQLSAEAVAELSKNLAKLDVRTPLEELMAISASAGQLGLKSVEDIQGFTEAANMLMIALPEMGKEAATEMMRVAIATGEVNKIRKQLEEGTVEGSNATAVAMTKIASTIDRLRASSASTAPEITDFVKRLGAVAAQSGISIDQVAALGSTISSLGMRVEMSATALSRMIPAIKNNAFAIANAIGVTPEALRSLFEAGRGMEAILMIFQHLKEQNANADTIENLLGIGNMKDVMKQLNQQGARAGIVFAGLSQNVDELRKQLVIAGDAYERNTAIQDEFNRMNDTTAAKWERLKNTIEEMVVSDWTQRVLGGLIEGVHKTINLLVGNSGLSTALLTIITLFGVLKLNIMGIMWSALATALAKIVDLFKNWRIALDLLIVRMKAMTAAQWTNVFLAVAAAVGILIYRLQQLSERASIVANEMAKANEEILKQTGAVDKLFRSVAKTNAELENAKKRLEEVARASNDTTESENALKKASSDHAAAIRDINSKYGTYLGYMISETSSAQQLAAARELINKKLRETITLKQQEAAMGSVEQEYGGKVNKKATDMEKTLGVFYGEDYDTAARVSVAISEAAQKYAKDSKEYQKTVKKILADNKIQKDVAESYMGTFEDYREAIEDYQKQTETVNRRFEATNNINRKQTREAVNKDLNAILGDWKDLVDQYRKAEGEEKEKLAAEVYKQQRAYANAVANNAEYFDGDKRKEVYDQNIKNMKTYEKGLRSVAGEAIRTIDAMERAEGKITGLDLSNDGESNKNPWGGGHDAASTDWKNMTANQLVERRKQMKDFVNAIQTDTDVQSVLKEDAALKKAIENGMSSDMRTVIEWYNTERLKIQDELHARHLTNTGDWMDPKKQRGAHKQFKAELDAYLEELDAYYTERKAEIEKARSDEEITEGEAWRRNLKNENEWYNRRAELLKLYAEKSGEVTQAEQDAIVKIIAERTGDSVEFVRAMIKKTIGFAKQIEASGEKGAAMVHDWYAKIDLKTQQSMLKSQQAITKQVKFIEDTLAKERPYDGITKNLQDNLDKMGVLAAKMRRVNDELTAQGKEQKYSDAEITAQTYKEMAFYLRQAEEAWSIDIDKLLRRMAEEGMVTTAEEISKSELLKQAVMGQLRKTFEEVQNAVKKEASQIKKDVDILWNDDTRGPGGMSMKAAFDQAIARLGMQQDSVSRANSLIGAGAASDNVAARLAMKQIEMQMRMQKAQFDMYRVQANQRMDALKREAAEHRRLAALAEKDHNIVERDLELLKAGNAERDAANVKKSLGLTLAEETKKEEENIANLLKLQEESQNRLYTSLREWADLLASSLQGVFEASHAGDAEYYNELAKMNLTGKGGPGAGTYIVIDNEGTEDATAHYEYLDERAALERQHEIERENAQAEAWRKLMDDLNQKMNDQITDWINASMQNASIDANTQELNLNNVALDANTQAMNGLSEQLAQGIRINNSSDATGAPADNGFANDKQAYYEKVSGQNPKPGTPTPFESSGDFATDRAAYFAAASGAIDPMAEAQAQMAANDAVTQNAINNSNKQTQVALSNDQKATKSAQSSFAKMTAAANLYGIAYQTMANDNLSTAQKVQLFAVQAAGNAAIAMLTTDMATTEGEAAVSLPGILGKAASQLGPIAGPIAFAAMSALLGGLMGLAVSKIAKSKSTIAQATGTSASAGRLATGMLTYASGNVNEFSNPDSLTVGRSYNVDGADGKTYRAKYMGKDAKTHITNGPEFHLVGEKGREAIIDAHTTRNIQLNEPEIWGAIKTLYNGGSLRHTGTRRGRGVRAFAEGNVEEFGDVMADGGGMMAGGVDIAAMTEAMNRQAAVQEALLERLNEPIYARNILYGAEGLPAVLQKLQREAQRHGEKYL